MTNTPQNKVPENHKFPGTLIILILIVIACVILMIALNNSVNSLNDEYRQSYDTLFHMLDSLGCIIH